MNRSTRGLAACAVGALALSGLTALATPGADAAGPSVRLLSQYTGRASLGYDNQFFSTTRLTARTAVPGAVVTLQVNDDPEATATDPGWTQIPGGTTTGPYVTVEWNGVVDDRDLAGERVALRAASTTEAGTSYAVRNDVEVGDRGDADRAVAVDTSDLRYFTQPYADSGRTRSQTLVRGTTTDPTGTVQLAWWRESTGSFTGATTVTVERRQDVSDGGSKGPDTVGRVYGGFEGVLDITGYDAAEGGLAVAATAGSDDVAPTVPVAQVPTSIAVESVGQARPGGTGRVQVDVRDQDGQLIVGAEVRRVSDRSVMGYTDANGRVVVAQAGGSTEQYYVNATDADGFDAADGDVIGDPVLVETSNQVPMYLGGFSLDGAAFDVDEYAAGDVGIVVLDEGGQPVAGAPVSYKLYPATAPEPAGYATGATGPDGVFAVPFDVAGPAGEYVLQVQDTTGVGREDQFTRFVAGQAVLTLNPKAPTVDAPAGGQVAYVGRLRVEGRPLPGRAMSVTYRRGTEVVPGNTADAGILGADGKRVLATTATTNGNGTFRVTVDDAAEAPQASETGGVLTAATALTSAGPGPSTTAGNAGARDTSTTRFGTAGPGKAGILLSGNGNKGRADVLRVTGPASLAGEQVQVFRVRAGGKLVRITTRRLDAGGDLRVVVRDGNRRKPKTYVVKLLPSPRVQATTSQKVRLV